VLRDRHGSSQADTFGLLGPACGRAELLTSVPLCSCLLGTPTKLRRTAPGPVPLLLRVVLILLDGPAGPIDCFRRGTLLDEPLYDVERPTGCGRDVRQTPCGILGTGQPCRPLRYLLLGQ
jgi:hypothetical protein